MPQRTLRFRIHQDGLVEETVEGVQGDSCLELTKRLETALGVVEQRQQTTDAFIVPNEQAQLIPAEIL
tara:strand:- start:123 stop:326 length:204 start_codon:yes stop_codon:yes gene_type:complete